MWLYLVPLLCCAVLCCVLCCRKSREPIKEKNWMPFVWQDELFMVHSVFPQRVFR